MERCRSVAKREGGPTRETVTTRSECVSTKREYRMGNCVSSGDTLQQACNTMHCTNALCVAVVVIVRQCDGTILAISAVGTRGAVCMGQIASQFWLIAGTVSAITRQVVTICRISIFHFLVTRPRRL